MKKVKVIIKILTLTLLWLSITITQASDLNVENVNDKLSKKNIEQAINNVIVILKKEYVYPQKSLLIEEGFKHKLATNELDDISDWYSFIRSINAIMRNVSGDMYLDIVETSHLLTLEKAQEKSELDNKDSLGVHSAEILSGNVGYMKLNHFYQNPEVEIEIYRTLNELSNVDALIIDLRDSEGDSISLALYLMSFFVQENTILSEVLYEKQEKIKILRSFENTGSDKFKHNFPIYILTSSFLSSSGEFFSYTLKHLKKAVIVGEETMGVAYILKKQKINDYISINIPIAIPLHPITHTNWEKTGVIPDVDTNASLSLSTAHKMAKKHLGVF